MPNAIYRKLLYFICGVISVTLGIQLYWNYKNYEDGKQQLIREVQSSADSAIDSYFIDLAKRNTIGISLTEDDQILENTRVDSLLQRMGREPLLPGKDVLRNINPNEISAMNIISRSQLQKQDTFPDIATTSDELAAERDLNLAKRIILSFKIDTLEIPILNKYINEQLRTKGIDADYAYTFKSSSGIKQQHNERIMNDHVLQTTLNSAYLPKNSTFDLYFTNIAPTVLKRNSLGLLLSAVLVGTVVACLFFLLKIINKQKQVAELKNDLISNITHEFKTPLSTAKVALEGIQNFNEQNDPLKTKNYLQISNTQLDKLQLMVEKLLETAALDGNNLHLNRERVPLMQMISELVERQRNLLRNKTFQFETNLQKVTIFADPFHLENALNNVLDNAVQYGGDKIEVVISDENQMIKIRISDNGTTLTRLQADQVFEKFYRVPKGNTHDIKGFGIGLYYTKNIIEKHGGSIQLHLNEKTNFIITLPKNE